MTDELRRSIQSLEEERLHIVRVPEFQGIRDRGALRRIDGVGHDGDDPRNLLHLEPDQVPHIFLGAQPEVLGDLGGVPLDERQEALVGRLGFNPLRSVAPAIHLLDHDRVSV
jgi:hypothetical protein